MDWTDPGHVTRALHVFEVALRHLFHHPWNPDWDPTEFIERLRRLFASDGYTFDQLKYFPEGFSGGFRKTRREQIRCSYNKMLKEEPHEWVLVVPNNLTPTERTFVIGLGKGVVEAPRWRVIDRTGLDDLLVDFPEVDRWAQRNVTTELLENAKTFNREIDSLLRPDDLVTRVADLGRLVDSIDLDWTYDSIETVTPCPRSCDHSTAARIS